MSKDYRCHKHLLARRAAWVIRSLGKVTNLTHVHINSSPSHAFKVVSHQQLEHGLWSLKILDIIPASMM